MVLALTADLPVEISDAAWQILLPFLREFPNVYVGNPHNLPELSFRPSLDDKARRDLV